MIATSYAEFRTRFSITGTLAADGYPVWDLVPTNIIRPWTNPFPLFPVDIDVAGADDAGAGIDEWNWYLSIPNLGTSDAYLSIARLDTPPTTRSGRIRLSLGPAAAGPMDATKANKYFRGAFLYARDLIGNDLHVADLHRSAFAPASLDV